MLEDDGIASEIIPPAPCDDCGGIVYRWDAEGVQRCAACDPGLREYALAMLEEVQTQPREQHDWNWFLRATHRKGYKLSWARAQYRRVIGKWPPRTLKCCPADPKSEDWQRQPIEVYPEFYAKGKVNGD